MVEQADAEEVGPLPEPAGEHAVFLARCGVAGRVIVLCDVSNYVEFLQTDASAPA